MSKTSVPFFLSCAILFGVAPAIGAEAFVQQAAFKSSMGERASRASALLGTPILPSQVLSLASSPARADAAPFGQNFARVSQVGSQNQAVVAQLGTGNQALIAQRGQGNIAVVSQTGSAR